MTVKIDREQAVALLERAVFEKGADYVYQQRSALNGPSCVYVDTDTGAPSCIIGHLVSYVAPETLLGIAQWERSQESTYTGTDVRELKNQLVDHVEFDYEALYLLRSVQTAQDGGMTWGQAVERAK